MKKFWMVRAGKSGYLFDIFKNEGLISIGWEQLGNLQNEDYENIKSKIRVHFPDYKPGAVNITAGQFHRFIHEFKIGDLVMTYDTSQRIYLVGEIISDYIYQANADNCTNIRRVKWLHSVNRDILSTTTKNSIDSAMTLFEVPSHARIEIQNTFQSTTQQILGDSSKKNDDETLDTIKEDFILKSHEFIKDKILSLDWEEMQELVAGILRAMGYKTRISPKGADRGKDIVASPDGLGLEDPKILVEVKHRNGAMGSQDIRSFLGGLRNRDKGLYVSTGGFTKDAQYEAERSVIPLTLLDADLLVELTNQYYESFDSDTKALIPLKKIFWPA